MNVHLKVPSPFLFSQQVAVFGKIISCQKLKRKVKPLKTYYHSTPESSNFSPQAERDFSKKECLSYGLATANKAEFHGVDKQPEAKVVSAGLARDGRWRTSMESTKYKQ